MLSCHPGTPSRMLTEYCCARLFSPYLVSPASFPPASVALNALHAAPHQIPQGSTTASRSGEPGIRDKTSGRGPLRGRPAREAPPRPSKREQKLQVKSEIWHDADYARRWRRADFVKLRARGSLLPDARDASLVAFYVVRQGLPAVGSTGGVRVDCCLAFLLSCVVFKLDYPPVCVHYVSSAIHCTTIIFSLIIVFESNTPLFYIERVLPARIPPVAHLGVGLVTTPRGTDTYAPSMD